MDSAVLRFIRRIPASIESFVSHEHFRNFFHWRYSQVFIPTFPGLAVAMAAMDQYLLAYLFLVLAVIWGFCFWWTSDFLKEQYPKALRKNSKPAAVQKRQLALRTFHCWRWLPMLAMLGIFVLACYWTREYQIQRELDSLEGWLYPANDPTPPTPCGILPKDSMAVLLGRATGVTNKFPHTILEVSGEPRVVVDRRPDGALAVSFEVRGPDQKIIASVDRNGYVVNQNNILGKPHRTDRSSIEVTDQYGRKVLSARFLNPHAFSMDAILNYPGVSPIVIGGNPTNGICVADAGRADIAIGSPK